MKNMPPKRENLLVGDAGDLVPFVILSSEGIPLRKIYGNLAMISRGTNIGIKFYQVPYLTLTFPSSYRIFPRPFIWLWIAIHDLDTYPDKLLDSLSCAEKLYIFKYIDLFNIPYNSRIVSSWMNGFHRSDYAENPRELASILHGLPFGAIPKHLRDMSAISAPTLQQPYIRYPRRSPPPPYFQYPPTLPSPRHYPSRQTYPVQQSSFPSGQRYGYPPRQKSPEKKYVKMGDIVKAQIAEIEEEPELDMTEAWEEDEPEEFDYKKASDEEIIAHVEDMWTIGTYLEETLLDSEEIPLKAKNIFRRQPCQPEDPIIMVEFDEDEIKAGLVRVRRVVGGRSHLICYTVSSLYNVLLVEGNKYFTSDTLGMGKILTPTGLSEKDLRIVTNLYARSAEKKIGDGPDDVKVLKDFTKMALDAELEAKMTADMLEREAAEAVVVPLQQQQDPDGITDEELAAIAALEAAGDDW